MKRREFLKTGLEGIVLASTPSILNAHERAVKAETYFPLHVGNSWTYVKSDDGSTKTFTIIGTEEVNGNTYYKFDDCYRPFSFPILFRYDQNSDTVLQYYPDRNEDIVRYDFSGNMWGSDGNKMIETDFLYTVPAGEFDNCCKFGYGLLVDCGMSVECGVFYETLAPDIGNIEFIKNSDKFQLQTYKINGMTYIEKEKPTLFSLQNFPNPFNSSTIIKYQIPENTKVNLDVYNISGQKIKTLVNKVQKPGLYQVKFDANDLSSGIYFYKLTTPNSVKTEKMMLVK